MKNPKADNTGFIEECIAKQDHKSLLVFLLQSLPNTLIRLNKFRGCIELYPLPSIPSEDIGYSNEPEDEDYEEP